MNPLIKKIADWLCRTFLACFLEIILEAFVHNWNRCVEVFNLNLKPYDIECLFGVSNCFDAFTVYNVKDITNEVVSDNLIILEDINANASIITECITIPKKSTSEDEFKLGKDSGDVSVDKKNNDSKNYKLVENDKHERYTQYPRSLINENIYLAGDIISHDFHNNTVCDKNSLYDKELLPVIQNSSDSEYSSLENEVKRGKDAVYSEISVDKRVDNLKKHESAEKDEQTQYLNIAMSIFDDSTYLNSNIAHNFHDESDIDKDNLLLEDEKFYSLLDGSVKSGNGSQDNLSTNSIPISIFNDNFYLASNATHNLQEDSDTDKDNVELEDEEFFHLLDESMKSKNDTRDNICTNLIPISVLDDNIDLKTSYTTHNFRGISGHEKDKRHFEDDEFFHLLDESAESKNGSQEHLYTNSIPINIFNDNTDLRVRNTTQNVSEDSTRDKNTLYFEGEAFSQLIDQSGISENCSQDNICTNLIPISTLTYGYDYIRKSTFSLHDDSDRDSDNLHLENDFCFHSGKLVSGKSENDSEHNLCKYSIKSKYHTYKGLDTKRVTDKMLTISSVHRAKNKHLKDIEERTSTEANVPTHDTSNKAKSQLTYDDKDISSTKIPSEDVRKTFAPVALRNDTSELKKEVKFPGNPNSNSLEFNINNESVEKKMDKSRVCFNDEIQTFIYEPISDIVDKLQSKDESKKGNALSIKDEIYAKLKFGPRHRSHDCINQDFYTADVENIVSVAKERSKYWSKFNLPCHVFRKNKSEECFCFKKENSGKQLSLNRMKTHHKSIKNKLLPNFFKK